MLLQAFSFSMWYRVPCRDIAAEHPCNYVRGSMIELPNDVTREVDKYCDRNINAGMMTAMSAVSMSCILQGQAHPVSDILQNSDDCVSDVRDEDRQARHSEKAPKYKDCSPCVRDDIEISIADCQKADEGEIDRVEIGPRPSSSSLTDRKHSSAAQLERCCKEHRGKK
jgi:hypothetical protein